MSVEEAVNSPYYNLIKARYGSEYSVIKVHERQFAKDTVEFEKALIIYALQRSRGNQIRAASYLGISRRKMQYSIALHNIDYKKLCEKIKSEALPQ